MTMLSLINRFVERVKNDGLSPAILAVLDYFGLDMVNLYNSCILLDPRIFTSCDIDIVVPKSTGLPHPIGIVIGHKVEIGDDVKILQNVTLGGRGGDNPPGMPTVEDNVTIGAGAIVIGNITLNEGCTVAANSLVLDDVEEGETVAGTPASSVD